MPYLVQRAEDVPPPDASLTDEALCRRALGDDAPFLALLRRPGLDLLPLPVLTEEPGAVLEGVRATVRRPLAPGGTA